MEQHASWPPNPEMINKDAVKMPNMLESFLRMLFVGEDRVGFQRIDTIIKSFGQDILHGVSRPTTKAHSTFLCSQMCYWQC